jgi:hypothetical protein
VIDIDTKFVTHLNWATPALWEPLKGNGCVRWEWGASVLSDAGRAISHVHLDEDGNEIEI